MTASRLLIAAALLLAYGLLCALTAWRWRQGLRQQHRQLSALQLHPPETAQVLVAHASQTGTAEQLALQTAQQLQAQGQAVCLLPLNAVTAATLAQVKQLWLIASTYGEGDAPDGASAFADRMLGQPATGALAPAAALQHLQFGVLALGDRQYQQFCAFGHRMQQWLEAQGAQPRFAAIEAHQTEAPALQRWQQQLGLSGPALQQAPLTPWRLVARTHINPRSQGAPLYWLTLQPELDSSAATSAPHWQAGDLLQLQANPALCQSMATVHRISRRNMDQCRSYSIASVPSALGHATALNLLVRLAQWPCEGHAEGESGQPSQSETLTPPPANTSPAASQAGLGELGHAFGAQAVRDGRALRFGLCSGQLAHAPLGSQWLARVQANPGFHMGDNAQRPLILIGNGSGLAGLQAHVLARMQQAPAAPVWLVYGERQRAHDAHFVPQWQQWLAQGQLAHLSLCYSREGEAIRHVQDALRAEAPRLREWVAGGAAIYVCGSLHGMSAGVDAALHDTLGRSAVAALLREGRLRRDVY